MASCSDRRKTTTLLFFAFSLTSHCLLYVKCDVSTNSIFLPFSVWSTQKNVSLSLFCVCQLCLEIGRGNRNCLILSFLWILNLILRFRGRPFLTRWVPINFRLQLPPASCKSCFVSLNSKHRHFCPSFLFLYKIFFVVTFHLYACVCARITVFCQI